MHRLLMSLVVLLLASTLADAGSIPVVVDRFLPDARSAEPVKFGTPFPIDTLKVDSPIAVVDDKGQTVPSQSRVLATWDASGSRGVRWLLVDFCADPQRQYRIVHGDDLPAALPAAEPIAKLQDQVIALNTGPLRGMISTQTFDLFSPLVAQGQPVVQRGPEGEASFAAFYVQHEKLGLFRSDLDPAPIITLEETGPIRATIKIDGWYTNEAGEQFCRYAIRAHFFRGRSDIRLDHTFIYTGKSVDDKIIGLGLQLPQKPGLRGYFGGEGLMPPAVGNDFTSTIKVIQDSPDHQQFELVQKVSATTPGARDRRIASRGSGWLSYGPMTAAIRDAWQQYPYGFDVRDGRVRIELWPEGGRLLDTTFDGYWWYLNEHQKRFMLGTKPKKPDDMDAWIARFRQVNATGAAKTHELWLSFPASAAQAITGGRLAREVAYPTIAFADLDYATATKALDFCPQTPRNDALFRDEENYLQAVLTMVEDLTEQGHWYGWWAWGSYYQAPGQRKTFTHADGGGEDIWHRNRPKSHYGWGQLPWLQYHRTGDRRWLRYAQTYTLYSADRAHVHHTGHGRITGEEYHYDHSDIPWVGGWQGNPIGAQPTSNLQQKDDYVYMYWLTGDRRALDVLQNWGEQIQGKTSLFKWKPGMERGNDIRNAGQQLHRLMMLHQATWDERYLTLAKQVADSFAGIETVEDLIASEGNKATANGPEVWRFHTAGGWAYEGLWLYYNLTGDERIGRTLMAFIERSRAFDSGIGWGYCPMRAYTYGYLLTQDETYLDLVRAICDDVVSAGLTPRAWSPDTAKFTTITLGRGLALLAHAPQEWRQRHLPTHQRGRTLRFRYAPYADRPLYAPSVIVFRETTDQSWKFRLLFSHGGKWVLTRPDGSVAYESPMIEFPFDQKDLVIEIPSDGMSGDYVLRCVEPSQWHQQNRRTDSLAEAKVLQCDLPWVVSIAGDNSALLGVRGRSMFFIPRQAGTVHVTPSDFKREMSLWADERKLASTQGQVGRANGSFTLPIIEEMVGQVLEFRQASPPDQWYGDNSSSVAAARYFWIEGAPPWVAANPDEWFEPKAAP